MLNRIDIVNANRAPATAGRAARTCVLAAGLALAAVLGAPAQAMDEGTIAPSADGGAQGGWRGVDAWSNPNFAQIGDDGRAAGLETGYVFRDGWLNGIEVRGGVAYRAIEGQRQTIDGSALDGSTGFSGQVGVGFGYGQTYIRADYLSQFGGAGVLRADEPEELRFGGGLELNAGPVSGAIEGTTEERYDDSTRIYSVTGRIRIQF